MENVPSIWATRIDGCKWYEGICLSLASSDMDFFLKIFFGHLLSESSSFRKDRTFVQRNKNRTCHLPRHLILVSPVRIEHQKLGFLSTRLTPKPFILVPLTQEKIPGVKKRLSDSYKTRVARLTVLLIKAQDLNLARPCFQQPSIDHVHCLKQTCAVGCHLK